MHWTIFKSQSGFYGNNEVWRCTEEKRGDAPLTDLDLCSVWSNRNRCAKTCGWQSESDQCHQIHGAKSWTGLRDRTRVPKSLRWAILFGMRLFWSGKMWGKRDFAYSTDINRDQQRLKTSRSVWKMLSFQLAVQSAGRTYASTHKLRTTIL